VKIRPVKVKKREREREKRREFIRNKVNGGPFSRQGI
jgi:hypothetical protein